MTTISEHDLCKQECAHIISQTDIVLFSRKFENVNLGMTRRIDVSDQGRCKRTTNLADHYWKREEQHQYQQKCREFDEGKLDYNPRDVTLYTFIANFDKKWEKGIKRHINPEKIVAPPVWYVICKKGSNPHLIIH